MKTGIGLWAGGGGRKTFVLLLLSAFTLVSSVGAFLLTGAIADGERQLAEGRRRLRDGYLAVAKGKDELAAGRRELAEGETEYKDAERNLFLLWADKLLRGGSGFRKARGQIAEGNREISEGAVRITAGEERVEAGQRVLRSGQERLRMAKGARLACAGFAILSASATIMLGFRWKRAEGMNLGSGPSKRR